MNLPFVRLPLFEGPLDLLLHLCRRHELNPAELNLSEVTEQFLAYLEVMEELEIEVAGEFVEMAATLCLVKSRELLPRLPDAAQLEDELEDPRGELIARLLEYKSYRDAARRVASLPRLNREFFVRGGEALALTGLEREDAPLDVDLVDLLGALRDLLERRRAQAAVHEVGGAEQIPLESRMRLVVSRLSAQLELPFPAFFERSGSRAEVVVTFLAILELARQRLLALVQEDQGAGILVRRLFEGEPEVAGV